MDEFNTVPAPAPAPETGAAASVLAPPQPEPQVADEPFHDEETADAFLGLMKDSIQPPADPSAYTFPYEQGADLDAEQQQQDTTLRTWMHAAGLPADIGSAIASDVDAFASRVAGFTEEQHQLQQRETLATLERAFGEARTAELVKLARGLVAQLDAKHGGAVSAWLDATGVGNSPNLITQLALHAERRALVAKARGVRK